MHYLEDYLELLEPLREIMREKLTLMRENDLKFQVDFAQLEEDSSEFLTNYRFYQKQSLLSPTKSKINIDQLPTFINEHSTHLTTEQAAARQEKQIEYDKLAQRYKELLQITTSKIHLANESHEFVERYFKKLENDLHKFKMELEADYAGLTEILEKRFADEGCDEYGDGICDDNTFDSALLDIEPLFESYDDLTMSNTLTDDYTNSYLLSQSRRLSNSLTPYLLNRKQHQRLHSSSRGRKRLQDANNIGKRKRSLIPSSFLTDYQYLNPSDSDDDSSTNTYLNFNNSISFTSLFDDETNLNGQLTETIDQRRYCFCNEMSYGDMIACDHRNCRREWFHYSCVGIITPPKGKWFCADCAQIVQQKLQISNTKRT